MGLEGDNTDSKIAVPQREWFEKDYYSVLGVPQAATEKELTRAYRKLAEAVPPGHEPGLRGEFKEIRPLTTSSVTPRSARSTTRRASSGRPWDPGPAVSAGSVAVGSGRAGRNDFPDRRPG